MINRIKQRLNDILLFQWLCYKIIKVKCFVHWHEPDNDYILEWYSKRYYSECKHCKAKVYHN